MAEPKQYKNKHGVFYEMWAYVGVDEITGKQSTKHRKGFRTKKAAREWAAGVKAKAERGDLTQNTAITFKAFCQSWLVDVYKNRVRETTYLNAKGLLEHHVIPTIGQQQLKRITSHVIQTLVNKLATEFGYSLYKRCYHLTMQVLDNAKRQGLIARVPDGITLKRPQAKAGDDPDNFWTPDEFTTFINNQYLKDNPRWLTIFNVLAFSAMRQGELVALTWQDVDFEANTIRVNKTASRGTDKLYIVTAPKTEAGRRTIPMDDETMALLKRWRLIQIREMLTLGFNANSPTQLVFPTQKNTMASPVTINMKFKVLQSRYKIKHEITAHGLRHSLNSAMAAAKDNTAIRMAVLGQRDGTTNEQVYTHTTPDQVRQAVNNAAKYLRKEG